MNAVYQVLDSFKTANHFPAATIQPVLCNFCGEEIDPFDYDAIEFTGTLYGHPHTERICGCCQQDPDSKGCLEKVKNLKKSFINR